MPEAEVTCFDAGIAVRPHHRGWALHTPSTTSAMAPSSPAVKRLFSSLPEQPTDNNAKRIKRPYHHHHRLHEPVNPGLSEPAITDDSYVDQVMNRTISLSLRECGFEIADPLALESFRDAAEEYLLKLASYVRASMLSSRRLQPIPNDFEYALKRHHLPVNSLIPYLQPPPKTEPIPTQLPSPPPEEDDDFKTLPNLGPQLSGEDDRVRSPYIPKHFPEFPSKHTYRHTPVFTERERDPRKIRERAADDGRHGEEALRKLARAAFKDNQPGSGGRDRKPWGRKAESFDSMFEKTVRSISKKALKSAAPGGPNVMDVDTAADTETKQSRSKGLAGLELPPIINCERDLWRRNAASGRQRPEEKSGTKQAPDLSRVESWVGT
ncbi:transcription factor TFIID complex subunit 8 C-term-domain-containing protein [Aspergillus pseudodeflectus]|uniref:Transcription initiation factor TFIID subunit 8 n=1 Tax=Aspergillus pseudodeflectus TaxID=176178 RepID=A0ABR4KJW9_9EURO